MKNKIDIVDIGYDPENVELGVGENKISKDLSYKLGLDLQGGTQLTYQVDMKDVAMEDRDSAFESIKNIIDRRINLLGVSEPNIQTIKSGESYRLVVELPGISNSQNAIDLIGQTAQLTFWQGSADSSLDASATDSADLLQQTLASILSTTPEKLDLTGKDLKRSQVSFDNSSGGPQVQLQFTSEGAKKFANITKENVGKIVAKPKTFF